MQDFNTNFFEKFLSQPYLSQTNKDRLREGLSQFYPQKSMGESNNKNYTHFYLLSNVDYLLQGDILPFIRQAFFDIDNTQYRKIYTEAIIISSTCDIEDESKNRDVPKQILFAPVVELGLYAEELKNNPKTVSKTPQIINAIKQQQKSNLFYLPPHPTNHKEYIAILDRIFWFPAQELQNLNVELLKARIATLDYFGFYLFLLKISYHLCRLPEDRHR